MPVGQNDGMVACKPTHLGRKLEYHLRSLLLPLFAFSTQNETCEFLPSVSSSSSPTSSSTRLDIYLLNGHVITLDDVAKSDSAHDVRDKLAKTIQLPEELAVYFGLVLVYVKENSPPSQSE